MQLSRRLRHGFLEEIAAGTPIKAIAVAFESTPADIDLRIEHVCRQHDLVGTQDAEERSRLVQIA